MDHIIETLKDFGLCNEVHYKELYVPQAELDGEVLAGLPGTPASLTWHQSIRLSANPHRRLASSSLHPRHITEATPSCQCWAHTFVPATSVYMLILPLPAAAALNSEQKALVDFLVLSRGRGFVGFGSSTFSFYLREFRVLNGIPRSSSVLVDASVIGTDPLFHSAGTVI